jgi:hypothetical protein
MGIFDALFHTTSRKKKASSRELGIFDAHLYDIQKEESTVCRWTNFDALCTTPRRKKTQFAAHGNLLRRFCTTSQKEESRGQERFGPGRRGIFGTLLYDVPRRKKA